ncbi:MAG: hypothetical protein ACRC1W_01340 [Shewanella sp.]
MQQLLDLGKLTQYRFQKIEIIVANTAPAGNYSNNVQLDRQFNKIVGIGYFEKADGGIPLNYDIGAKTDRQTWLDPININAWKAEQAVGPMKKYYTVNIPYASGDTFYAMINTGAVLTANLTGQMVLVLAKDLTELPR